MLTESAYQTALLTYGVAALLALFLFDRWLLRRWRTGWRLLLLLPLAALLLTPAYIDPDASTLAPAAIVAAFRSLTEGVEAAEHALRPLAVFTASAFSAGLLIALFLGWRRRR